MRVAIIALGAEPERFYIMEEVESELEIPANLRTSTPKKRKLYMRDPNARVPKRTLYWRRRQQRRQQENIRTASLQMTTSCEPSSESDSDTESESQLSSSSDSSTASEF